MHTQRIRASLLDMQIKKARIDAAIVSLSALIDTLENEHVGNGNARPVRRKEDRVTTLLE
jgi:hypothetical protein